MCVQGHCHRWVAALRYLQAPKTFKSKQAFPCITFQDGAGPTAFHRGAHGVEPWQVLLQAGSIILEHIGAELATPGHGICNSTPCIHQYCLMNVVACNGHTFGTDKRLRREEFSAAPHLRSQGCQAQWPLRQSPALSLRPGCCAAGCWGGARSPPECSLRVMDHFWYAVIGVERTPQTDTTAQYLNSTVGRSGALRRIGTLIGAFLYQNTPSTSAHDAAVPRVASAGWRSLPQQYQGWHAAAIPTAAWECAWAVRRHHRR